MTTTREARIERLKEANDSVSSEALEDLNEQAKKAAANMLLLYGDKACLSATGFVYCIQAAHEAALLHLLSSGVVVLAADATASPEEQATRVARRKLTEHLEEKAQAAPSLASQSQAAYL